MAFSLSWICVDKRLSVFQLTEEKRVLDEEERRASEEYIQRLLVEDQELLQQETRRREEDEQLARLLSVQLVCAFSVNVLTVSRMKIIVFSVFS